MPPPGHTATTVSLPENRQVGDTEPTSKREAIRYLRTELKVTGAQANRLYEAYRRDQERPVATAALSYRPSFYRWLMEQAPTVRNRAVQKWQLGQGQWRTS